MVDVNRDGGLVPMRCPHGWEAIAVPIVCHPCMAARAEALGLVQVTSAGSHTEPDGKMYQWIAGDYVDPRWL